MRCLSTIASSNFSGTVRHARARIVWAVSRGMWKKKMFPNTKVRRRSEIKNSFTESEKVKQYFETFSSTTAVKLEHVEMSVSSGFSGR